jgi:hypothetical protein
LAKLDGDWCVALTELTCPTVWLNVSRDQDFSVLVLQTEIKKEVSETQMFALLQVSAPMFEWNQDIVNAIDWELDTLFHGTEHIRPRIKYNSISDSVSLTNGKNVDKSYSFTLTFSPALASLLRVDTDSEPSIFMLNDSVNTYRLSTITVCTDIIERSSIAGKEDGVLRVVPIKGRIGENMHHKVDIPYYIPLTSNEVSTVRIYLRDTDGQLITFPYGKCTVTLHFRRSS